MLKRCAILVAAALTFSEARANEATAAVDAWVAAFNTNEVEPIVATYAPSASVHGTLAPNLAVGTEAIRAYFAAGVRLRRKSAWTDSKPSR